jgi:thiamine-monophosphate kinase
MARYRIPGQGPLIRGNRAANEIAEMAEFDLIEILRNRCAQSRDDVRLGIGDDAALVCVESGNELVICTDSLVAGVHFPHDTAASDIGWKSLAVNLSDLAAMGATPAWATLALTLPAADSRFVSDFAGGFVELAAQHNVALIGGDTTRGPLSITVTAHGLVPAGKALRRDGARVGDVVFVTGTLGDAAAGLRCLKETATRSGGHPVHDKDLIARLNRPQPRIAAGLVLRELASACIDISDGLLADLGHVAARSGVGFEIGESGLPASAALFGRFDADTCVDFQMAGGDDYELAFTISESDVEIMLAAMAKVDCRVSRIGRVIAEAGVHVLDRDGKRKMTVEKGWEHFT